MILYFADRTMNIKGHASTTLLKGFQIVEDRKVEDIETGVASFECSISFDDKNRLLLEEMTNAGNYLLRSCEGVNEFYTIIDTEVDTKRKKVYIYAEDAGLDLLNEIAGEYEAAESYPITHYVEKWIFDSGFEIGINEVPNTTTRKLKWEGETSCTERLASIAEQFGGYEISYSFDVKGMEVSRKYVNIHKKRGKDIGTQLRLNRDIDRIITKKSVANLATAFVCTGGNMDSSTTIYQKSSNSVAYAVELETTKRTKSTITMTATIKAGLTTKNSELGEGYGLKASLSFDGGVNWFPVIIKATDKDNKEKWSGTTKHWTEYSFTVNVASAGVVTFSDIKFKVERTDSLGGVVGTLAATNCSNFSVPNYILGGENGEDISSRPITLEGFEYDDGDFYVGSDGVLRSRKAADKWSRYVWNKEPNLRDNSKGHIWRTYSYDTTDQETLCKHAITELKKVCDMEINFDIELKRLPDDVKIGDRVDIVDDAGELYLSTRILRLETSEVDREHKATLGEHLIKDSGISQKVIELADQFAEIAKNRVFYTWVAYADDDIGTGISLNPTGKEYLGIASNKLTKKVDISDPSIFVWTKIKGEAGTQGEAGVSVTSIVTQYYLSTSNTECVGGSWGTALPEWSSGKYIWEKQVTTWSDGRTTETDPILSSTLNHANEVANNAQQQANSASDAANSASNAANAASDAAQTAQQHSADAITSAQEANTKAQEAIETAASASTTAAQALADASSAQTSVGLVYEDINTINKDIADARAEAKAGLETVTETLTDSYAKKTELTEYAVDFETRISKNAAELSIVHKAIETIETDTDEAFKNANDAKAYAESAQSKAQQAVEDAAAAQTKADAASQAAQTAQNEATAADQALKEAQANLAAVTGRVDATEDEIAAAKAAVEAAQTAADAANANAADAQTAASNAQTDAANAKKAADDAQADATKALKDLAGVTSRVEQAETDIKKNANAIESTAKKLVDNYYTKTQSDSKFTITADKVSTAVREMTFGTRNLLVGSSTGKGWIGYNSFSSETAEFTRKATTSSETFIYCTNLFDLDSDKKYTLSFKAKYDGDPSTGMDVYILPENWLANGVAYLSNIKDLTTEYREYTLTFTPAVITEHLKNCQLRFDNNGCKSNGTASTLTIKEVMLIEGDIPSDWFPAPEDVATTSLVEQTANSWSVKLQNAEARAGQTATNYLRFDNTKGLIVADLTEEDELGSYVGIKNTGIDINTLAGTTVNNSPLYNTLMLRANGVSVVEEGVLQAAFLKDQIILGRDAETSSIDMLNGAFKIKYNTETEVIDGETVSNGDFGVYGKTSANEERLAFQPINENGNLTLGYGGYAAAAVNTSGDVEEKGDSGTNIWGNRIYLRSADNMYIMPRYNDSASDAWERYVYLTGHLQLANTYHLYGTTKKNTNGTGGVKASLAVLNGNNEFIYGFGSKDQNLGTAYYQGNDIIISSNNAVTISDNKPLKVYKIVGTGTNALNLCATGDSILVQVYDNGTYKTLRPLNGNEVTLGIDGIRWKEIWSKNALNTSSDRNVKKDITSMGEQYERLFNLLKPVKYKFIDGESGRYHTGFISQEVEEALSEVGLTALDFAAFCRDKKTKEVEDPDTGEVTFVDVCDENGEPEYNYSLRYEEFIALNTHMIQKLQAEKAELQDKVSSLEERLENLEALIKTQ